MTRYLRPVFLLIIYISIMVACAPVTATQEPVTTGKVESAYPGLLDPAVAIGAYPDPVLPVEAATPTLRAGLEASDPATFSLQSGDLQMVEFFAFW